MDQEVTNTAVERLRHFIDRLETAKTLDERVMILQTVQKVAKYAMDLLVGK